MKKYFLQFGVLITLMLVLTACPYSSENPMDAKPSVKLDDKLLGQWESKSSTDYLYTVSKADDNTYKIEKKSNSSGDVTTYKGFLSTIDATRFMNIYEETSSETKTYYFYKVDISTSGGKITFSPVTENITEKFTNSEELKAFFKKHMGLSFFFDKDPDVYIRHD
ncbi:MAG: hypothetical protein K0S33_4163 [Bacteroidetes bacterium]|jgi:hypothetical protein|nr:hypothetical protein [Bacteroidota bacterium]